MKTTKEYKRDCEKKWCHWLPESKSCPVRSNWYRWTLLSPLNCASWTYCPHSRTATRQCRALSVAAPTTWIRIPTTLRQVPVGHSTSFFTTLEIVLVERGWPGSSPE